MNEVAVIDAPPIRSANPMDMMPTEFRGGLQRRQENRKSLVHWIRESLVDGVDFGVIQTKRGPSKPSLRKPGAEKICGMLGVTATFPTLKDYEGAALEGREIRQIILRCHLVAPTGEIVADGVGARSVEQDHGDLNKALKMAIKSAHIDATLRMAGLSEIFTQDIEDMPKERIGDEEQPQNQADPKPRAATKSYTTSERYATERQIKLLMVKLKKAGLTDMALIRHFDIEAIEKLPFEKVSLAIAWIDGEAKQVVTRERPRPLSSDFDADLPDEPGFYMPEEAR